MTQITYPLKYLFTAHFADGSYIQQTIEDKSTIDPEKRSAFFDVLEAEKNDKKITSFALRSDQDLYCVDLTTGQFIHNGKQFLVGDELDTIESLQLIYYRRVRHHFNMGNDGKPTSHQGTDVAYFLGFQTNDNTGKKIERKIGFD